MLAFVFVLESELRVERYASSLKTVGDVEIDENV